MSNIVKIFATAQHGQRPRLEQNATQDQQHHTMPGEQKTRDQQEEQQEERQESANPTAQQPQRSHDGEHEPQETPNQTRPEQTQSD